MLSFKELREKRMAVSADFKISASGRKVHKMKKVADTEDDFQDDDKEDDKKDVKESTLDEEFSSGNAQHALSGKSEKQQHSDYMKKTHNVTTKYHGSDEVSYHGTKANVKKALVNHYDNEGEAKSLHPQAFKESVDESVVPDHMRGKQKPYVSSDGKGNYEVLGNKGQTKAEFSRSQHGSMAQGKAQAHLKSKYNEYMKEETELEEAVDKQEQRFIQLARLGLVDKSNVSKLRMAIDQLKADKPLTVPQRTLLLGVMMDLVDLVTGDDAVFQRVKMDVQKEGFVNDAQRKAVWASRNDAKKEETEPPFDGPYTKTKPPVTDKSGAVHTPISRARHLARLALAKQVAKSNKAK